jgi:glycosyltransferase involved in cell wall biosynthesis
LNDQPLVSIITPSFNQGRFLEATICSVFKQDYSNIEYILVDGGSQDESLEVIQRYAGRLAYWESQPDRGQAHAINKGLARSHGDLLGWLNSDDLLQPGSVRRAVEIFSAYPEIDVVYGRLDRIDEQGRLVPTPLLPKDRVEFSKNLVLGECVVNQPGAFWRRSIMQRAGLLDEGLQFSLDYEYWIRLALHGAQFKRIPDVLACFRLSAGSKTVAHTALMAREQIQVLDQLSSRPDLPALLDSGLPQIQSKARRTRARFCLQAFYGELKNREWREAFHWLLKALRNDPRSFLDRRYFELGLSNIRRRLGR